MICVNEYEIKREWASLIGFICNSKLYVFHFLGHNLNFSSLLFAALPFVIMDEVVSYFVSCFKKQNLINTIKHVQIKN